MLRERPAKGVFSLPGLDRSHEFTVLITLDAQNDGESGTEGVHHHRAAVSHQFFVPTPGPAMRWEEQAPFLDSFSLLDKVLKHVLRDINSLAEARVSCSSLHRSSVRHMVIQISLPVGGSSTRLQGQGFIFTRLSLASTPHPRPQPQSWPQS